MHTSRNGWTKVRQNVLKPSGNVFLLSTQPRVNVFEINCKVVVKRIKLTQKKKKIGSARLKIISI